jgi:hypothetical protein
MHVSTKVSDRDGAHHVITSVIEADGAFEIMKEDQVLTVETLSATRTLSGGVEIVTLVTIGNKVAEEIQAT